MEESLPNLGGAQVNQLTRVRLSTKGSRGGGWPGLSTTISKLWVPHPSRPPLARGWVQIQSRHQASLYQYGQCNLRQFSQQLPLRRRESPGRAVAGQLFLYVRWRWRESAQEQRFGDHPVLARPGGQGADGDGRQWESAAGLHLSQWGHDCAQRCDPRASAA